MNKLDPLSLVSFSMQYQQDFYPLFFKNGPTLASFCFFRSFQTNIITIFTANMCEKCPSNIQCWDSNPRPLEHESLPITTRPGLPP